MPYQQISLVITAAETINIIDECFFHIGALSTTCSNAGGDDLLEPIPGVTSAWEKTQITALFDSKDDIQQKQILLMALLGDIPYEKLETSVLADKNWVEVSQQHNHPKQFGQRLWIYPKDKFVEKDDKIVVYLNPGLAFGTGAHPTTDLCLQWLDANPPKGETVIDYGCGSGILAIAAVKLGAGKVIAVDYDNQAIIATRDNQKFNNVSEDELTALLPEDLPFLQCELVLANILANPIKDLRDEFYDILVDNGDLVLSGILSEQVDDIVSAYENKFLFVVKTTKEEWACLHLRKTIS